MVDCHRFDTRAMLALVLFGALWVSPSFAQQDVVGQDAVQKDVVLPSRYSVHFFQLQVEKQDLRMAYRDVPPTGAANGKCVLLLHGKNFSGFYWESTIEFLAQQGYRVIAPDQLGFGASSRPDIH